jgi:DNA gyrase subunit A
MQTTSILDMPLGRLTQLGRDELSTEQKGLSRVIRDLKRVLASRSATLELIVEELRSFKDQVSSERRTSVSDESGDITVEQTVLDEPAVVSVTSRGYVRGVVKRPRVQVPSPPKGDAIIRFHDASTAGYVTFVSSHGRAYRTRIADLVSDKFVASQSMFDLKQAGERIVDSFTDADLPEDSFLMMVTSAGETKRLSTAEITKLSTRRDGAVIIGVGDSLVIRAAVVGDSETVTVVTAGGMASRFRVGEVRPTGRVSGATRGIKLRAGDSAVAAVISTPETTGRYLAVDDTGRVWTVESDEIPVAGRGGSGARRFKSNTGLVTVIPQPTSGQLLVGDHESIVVADIPDRAIKRPVQVEGSVQVVYPHPSAPQMTNTEH